MFNFKIIYDYYNEDYNKYDYSPDEKYHHYEILTNVLRFDNLFMYINDLDFNYVNTWEIRYIKNLRVEFVKIEFGD